MRLPCVLPPSRCGSILAAIAGTSPLTLRRSEEILQQTSSYPEYTWLTYRESLAFSRATNPDNKKVRRAGGILLRCASDLLLVFLTASPTRAQYTQHTQPHFGITPPCMPQWDAVLKSNREKSMGGNAGPSTNPNMQLAMLTTVDVMLLAQCDLFVGKVRPSPFIAHPLPI